MIWELANISARLIVVAVCVIKLTRFYHLYRTGERVGLGIAGGCALMTLPVLWEGPTSPFAEWAGAFFAGGVALYFLGRLQRQLRHERANDEMARLYEERAR